MLAVGYLDDGPQPFLEESGQRWLVTGDAGSIADGVLTVTGRIDEVIVTGGVKVHPAAVESALAEAAEVAEVCGVGVPDHEGGELATAVVVPAPGASTSLPALRERAGGGAHAPRALVTLPALPVRGPGKTDRRRAAELAGEALSEGRGQDRKSTRLNSSYVAISYAVFCLKK